MKRFEVKMKKDKKSEEKPSPGEITEQLAAILEKLERLERRNNELQQILRVIAQPILWSTLNAVFLKPQQLWAYELTDGNRSTRDIGKIVGVDQKTISTWWRSWAQTYGIVKKTGGRGQFQQCYSLLELLLMFSENDGTELG